MSAIHLNASLSDVEQLLDGISAALLAGEPMELEVTSTALRQAMVNLSAVVRAQSGATLQDADLRQRLKKVSQTLSLQRSNLLRRAVVVDGALASLLPQVQQQPTYSDGNRAAMYRGGAARIYTALAT